MLANGCLIETDYLNIIKCPIPSGIGLQDIRSIIEYYLNKLPQAMESSEHDEWKEVKIMLGDKNGEFWIIMYRSNAFSSAEEARRYALLENKTIKPLQYIDNELKR
jgi:hypothetical protein